MTALTRPSITLDLVFGRSKDDQPPSPATMEPEEDDAPVGKGRPTPRRKEVEKARQRPLVPADRGEARRQARAKAKATRDREYQAMQTGDERFLPARDRGPVRRWVRDYVDSRWTLGEFFLPVTVAVMAAVLLLGNQPEFAVVIVIVLYAIMLATIVDAFVLSRVLKKKLAAKFGEEAIPRGSLMYGVTRAFQLRRLRLPKPQVTRGQRPS